MSILHSVTTISTFSLATKAKLSLIRPPLKPCFFWRPKRFKATTECGWSAKAVLRFFSWNYMIHRINAPKRKGEWWWWKLQQYALELAFAWERMHLCFSVDGLELGHNTTHSNAAAGLFMSPEPLFVMLKAIQNSVIRKRSWLQDCTTHKSFTDLALRYLIMARCNCVCVCVCVCLQERERARERE